MSSLTVTEKMHDRLIEAILNDESGDAMRKVDVAVLEMLQPVDKLIARLASDPARYYLRLAPALLSIAPEQAVGLSIRLLPKLDVADIDLLLLHLTEMECWPESAPHVARFAREETITPQLIYFIARIQQNAWARRTPSARKTLREVLGEKLQDLSAELNSVFPSYAKLNPALTPTARQTVYWSEDYLDPKWKTFEAFGVLTNGDNCQACDGSPSVWRASCRLCIALGQTSGLPDAGLIATIIGRNEDTDDRIAMLIEAQRGQQARQGEFSHMRQTILGSLVEIGLPASATAQALLAQFVGRTKIDTERSAAFWRWNIGTVLI